MKNQYFGDINDYRKYGLLRLLSGVGEITTAICWMLTPDDGRADGLFIDYLHRSEKWRRFDPDLYDQLRELVVTRNIRDIRVAERAGILPSSRFFPELLPDYAGGRAEYFKTFMGVAQGCDLIFFDPDNGIEVKSKPYGRKGSSKYLYWRELVASFSAGHSLLIYQHFPRVPRGRFVQTIARELAVRTGAHEVYSFRTPRVLFLLVPQEQRQEFFQACSRKVTKVWGRQIQIASHRAA